MSSKKPELSRGGTYWVALSGGLDSTVLLHQLHAQGLKSLHAIHIHHGLQAKADRWAAHCRAYCKALKVPFTLEQIKVPARSPQGPESAARSARYAAFRKHLRHGDCLVTAHHRDDQAETVLLRLLRGTGVQGLAAMRPLSDFEPGKLWRPLLDAPRTDLLSYAQEHKLKWIEDPHNREPRYARSWLRQKLMPQLEARFPSAKASLARAAAHAAEAAELLDVLAEQDSASAAQQHVLSVSALLALTPARRNNLLRHWIQAQGHEPPPAETLLRIETEVLGARADAEPLLAWGDAELRRYRDTLHVLTRQPRAALPKRKLPAGVSLRYAKGGEKLKPAGAAHTRSLKNLFQEAGIPPWVRQRTPLIYENDQLIGVLGLFHSARSIELGLQRLKNS